MRYDIYQYTTSKIAAGKKMMAILLDPDKCVDKTLEAVLAQLTQSLPDFIFIGGSSKSCNTETLITLLQHVPVPKVLFPGDASQFTPKADAMLFLSLLSGENPDYLIGQHRQSSLKIKESGIEVIPTAYLLIDGGNNSSVRQISKTLPIASGDVHTCVSTAVAGELLGMKMVYLEAGSGAENPVLPNVISAVKKELNVPLIAGGGLKTENQLQTALDAGADILVVGNVFETETAKIQRFIRFMEKYNETNTTGQ